MASHLDTPAALPISIPSPEATTSAILGASSAGWSPVRNSSRRATLEAQFTGESESTSHSFASPTSAADADANPASTSPARSRLGALKSHGLVSNSVFKQQSHAPQDDAPLFPSPLSSPSRRNGVAAASRATPATGVGLGIGIGATPKRSALTPTPRRTSAERNQPQPNRQLTGGGGAAAAAAAASSDAENDVPAALASPRKSRGIDALQRASFVSNSPFKNGAGAGAATAVSPPSTAPLQLPNNAWAKSAAAAAKGGAQDNAKRDEVPSTPTRRATNNVLPTEEDIFSTPDSVPRRRGDNSAHATPRGPGASGAAAGSPSSRGLLVSNRLHGPRAPMPPPAAHQARDAHPPSQRERRKTVTFDEMLDVQEFEKESSFERESVRSEASNASLASSATSSQAGVAADGGDAPMDVDSAQGNVVTPAADDNEEERMWLEPSSAARQLDRLLDGETPRGHGDAAAAGEQPAGSHLPHSGSDQSFERSYATAGVGEEDEELDEQSSSFDVELEYGGQGDAGAEREEMSFSAMHRVDSMVDELLHESMLASPATRSARRQQRDDSDDHARQPTGEAPAHPTAGLPALQSMEASIHHAATMSNSDEEPGRDDAEDADVAASPSRRRPLPSLPQPQRRSAAPRLSAAGLPTLPDWSPLMSDSLALPDEAEVEAALGSAPGAAQAEPVATESASRGSPASQAAAPASARPGGRPHISREEVLQRVAREKRQAQEATGAKLQQQQQQPPADASANRDSVAMSHAKSQLIAVDQPLREGGEPRAKRHARGSMPGSVYTKDAAQGGDTVAPPTSHPTPVAGRPSAPAQTLERASGASAAQSVRAEERAAAKPPSPVNLAVAVAESPLERLSAEMAAEQAQHASAAVAGTTTTTTSERVATPPQPHDGWFRGESVEPEPNSRDITPARRETKDSGSMLAPPPLPTKDARPVAGHDEDASSGIASPSSRRNSTASTTGGRLSPSLLGPAPAPITPSQQAEAIIARRRSKNGKPPPQQRRKRSLSTADAAGVRAGGGSVHGADDGARADGGGVAEPSSKARAVEGDATDVPMRHASDEDDDGLERTRRLLDASVRKALDAAAAGGAEGSFSGGEAEQETGGFGIGLEREISRIYKQVDQKYRVNDRGVFRGVDDKVSHSDKAGDVDSGRAWRKLRRPSDINEYAKELREYRANENPKRAAGKVFVYLDSFVPSQGLPVPTSAPTRFYCVLDNGLHVVRTANMALLPPRRAAVGAQQQPSAIAQEFELIQHKNLEFSLTLVAQRDAHLVEPRPVVAPRAESVVSKKTTTGSSLTKGVSRLFGSPRKLRGSPHRSGSGSGGAAAAVESPKAVEPMLAYLNRGGAFGRAHVVFEKVATKSLGRCYELELPVYGVPDAPGVGHATPRGAGQMAQARVDEVRGVLRLKIFYLPPMAGVPKEQLPDNLHDCVEGMRRAQWHANAKPWMEGVLTQLGGDCTSWRRRPVRCQGSHLVGYNEVTKKATVKIDLSKAVSIEEALDPHTRARRRMASGGSSNSGSGSGSGSGSSGAGTTDDANDDDDDDGEGAAAYELERSFKLTFADGETIRFFADTDEQKRDWIEALRKRIGVAPPPNPLWAQVALDLMAKAAAAASRDGGGGAGAAASSAENGSKQVADGAPVAAPSTSTGLPPPSTASRLPGSIGRQMRHGKISSETLEEGEEGTHATAAAAMATRLAAPTARASPPSVGPDPPSTPKRTVPTSSASRPRPMSELRPGMVPVGRFGSQSAQQQHQHQHQQHHPHHRAWLHGKAPLA